MENFIGFYYETQENVSMENFNQKIAEAIHFLKKSNDLEEDSIKETRHIYNKACKIAGRDFLGQYLQFEISKDGEISKHLDCFIDNQNHYMTVYTN